MSKKEGGEFVSEGTCQATRAEIVRGAREHYEEAAKAIHHWSSTIGHALDSYEREPELRAEISALTEIVRMHNLHWTAIADAIGTNGGYGGVDAEPLTPFSNAERVIKRVKAMRQSLEWIAGLTCGKSSDNGGPCPRFMPTGEPITCEHRMAREALPPRE